MSEQKEGSTESYDEGYEDGHDDGYNVGYNAGYEEGCEEGRDEGYEVGRTDEAANTKPQILSLLESHWRAAEREHTAGVTRSIRELLDTISAEVTRL